MDNAFDNLDTAVAQFNSNTTQELKAILRAIHPKLFEHIVGELLKRIGFEDIHVTNYTNDQGIDIKARLVVDGVTDSVTAIQVKRWQSNIGSKEIQQLRGSLSTIPPESGLLVTLSDFTTNAIHEAKAPGRVPVSLVNGDRLVELMIAHKLGVIERPLRAFELDPEFALQTAEDQSVDHDEEEIPIDVLPQQSVDALAGALGPANVPQKMRSKWLWPLPGGRTQYKKTLDAILHFIDKREPTMDEASSWMIAHFSRVNAKGVVPGFLRVPAVLGLSIRSREKYFITPLGREYLEDPKDKVIARLLYERIAGIEQIRDLLSASEYSITELREALNADGTLSVSTDAQITWRVNWMYSVGWVQPATGDLWKLVYFDP